ncbi:ABC transporter ATP-binding protein [Holospora undulata]|uniref:Putative ABC transporter ATP-binding protein n=1 Tax=Holospora undulata HU1 TaxID=1321371 RepID=A0A061JH77_9PROT|nr:ABC transporter ATP-binding protein [Holospora undulata]ETZ04627.1 putative ABC transporter ATP-binding protein [Holospora undulata HU1]ETZ05181.1 putative ABC transporter ATP-binding protein [Holospora undulata HU1]
MQEPVCTSRVAFCQLVSFLWKCCLYTPWCALFLILCPLLWAAELSLIPYAIGKFLDCLHPRVSYQEVLGPVLIFFSALLMVLFSYRLFNYMIGIRMVPKLRSRLAGLGLQGVFNMPYSALKEELPGKISGKISDLPKVIPELLEMFCWKVLAPLIALTLSLILLSQKDKIFALITFFWAVLFITGNLVMVPYLIQRSANFAQYGNQILGVISDSVLNVFTVKIYTSEEKEENYLQQNCKKGEKSERQLQWAYFFLHLCLSLLYVITLTVTLYVAFHRFKKGKISIGDLAVVMNLNLGISHVLWESSFEFSRIAQHLGRMKQVLEMFYVPPKFIQNFPEKGQKNVKAVIFQHPPSVRFDHVTFSYSQEVSLFENLCLTINAGEKVGLVGYSGAGKTSFVQLMLGLYPAHSGKILVNDIPINDMNLQFFYQNITFISQNPQFFRRTIWENLIYGSENATLERVNYACKQAGIFDRIQGLPNGYQTLLEDQGAPLSGGEKQRLSIAKAFLRNSPLLILDEVTAQQDALTEQSIQLALHELMKNKTSIVIAHRLKVVTLIDRLFVFNNGKIVQTGPHHLLLQQNGLYKKLWEAQNSLTSLTR